MSELGQIGGSRSPEAGGSKNRRDHGETKEEKLADHLAHIDSYTQRKIAETKALAGTGQISIEATMGVMKELVRASTTNPLVGAAVVCIFADLLTSLKVIQPGTRNIIFGFAGVGFGVEMSVELITAADGFLDALDPFKGSAGASPSADVMTPTATTVVYGDEVKAGGAAALSRLPPPGALLDAAAVL